MLQQKRPETHQNAISESRSSHLNKQLRNYALTRDAKTQHFARDILQKAHPEPNPKKPNKLRSASRRLKHGTQNYQACVLETLSFWLAYQGMVLCKSDVPRFQVHGLGGFICRWWLRKETSRFFTPVDPVRVQSFQTAFHWDHDLFEHGLLTPPEMVCEISTDIFGILYASIATTSEIHSEPSLNLCARGLLGRPRHLPTDAVDCPTVQGL